MDVRLSPPEADLEEAVLAFLRTWAAENEEGKFPNLVHLGADAGIRSAKAAALPREVALKTWIQRLRTVVLVKGERGQTTLQVVEGASPGYASVADDGGPTGGDPPPAGQQQIADESGGRAHRKHHRHRDADDPEGKQSHRRDGAEGHSSKRRRHRESGEPEMTAPS